MAKQMKAAICVGREKIEVREIPVPTPAAGEVLVKVRATGLCGSDVDGFTGHHPMIRWPIILGHEASGTIAACGPGVARWRIGDPVAIEPFFTCKVCPACLRGQYNLCVGLKITGHQVPGTMAEYVIAEQGFVHRKPESLSFEEAAIAEPASGSLHAVERCGLRLGDFVVVIGCGTIGSLAMQHCLNKGTEVLVADPDEHKLAVARGLGAHHAVDPSRQELAQAVRELTGGIGADCVIEAVGLPETLASTTRLVRRGGTIMLIGWSGEKADPIDLTAVTLDELTLRGTLGFCNDFPVALRLMSSGKIKIAPIISHRLPFTDAEKAIRMLERREPGVWKIVLTYG
jgi:L-iditol 2-dehydrogenase